MADVVAKLGIEVDATGAVREVKQFGEAADKTAEQGSRLEAVAGKLKVALAGAVTAAAIATVVKMMNETIAAQHAMAQLENAVRATGGAAGRTVQELEDMASALQQVTTYGDDAIQGAMTRLLSYTAVQGETFDRATRAILDFATAYRMDLVQAAELVGRALEYPERATEALSRQGFRFTEEQQKVIEALVETGRVAEAQAIILGSLEDATKGAAEAARDTLGGALAGLKNAWGDLFEISRDRSQGIIDAINGVTAMLERWAVVQSRLVKDVAAGWMRLTAMVEKFHNVMSIDLTGNIRAQWQEVKRMNEEIDRNVRARAASLWALPEESLIGGHKPAGHEPRDVTNAAEKAAKAIEEGARIYDTIMRRREAEAIDSTRRQIEAVTSTISDRVSGGIIGGVLGALGPVGGIVGGAMSSIVAAYVREFMVLRGGADIRSAMELNDIADASKTLGAGQWARVAGAGLGGAMFGYGFGQMTQSAFGGAAIGGMGGMGLAAVMGAGPLGVAVGGFAGALSGLIGGLTSATEKTRAWMRAVEDISRSIDMHLAQASGDDKAAQQIANDQWLANTLEALRQQYRAYIYFNEHFGFDSDGYQQYLAEVERARQAHAAMAASIDETAESFARINGQLLNLEGYKLTRAAFEAMDPLASRPRGPNDPPIPSTWQPGQPSGAIRIEIPVVLNATEVSRVVVDNLQQRAAATVGDAARWSEMMV